MAKVRHQDQALQRIKKVFFSAVAIIVVLGGAFVVWYTTDPGGGDGYSTVSHLKPDPDGIITVREFFSYACPHCRNFEPALNKWKEDLPEDVHFERVAVGGNSTWTPLSIAYYTMKELGLLDSYHALIFDALHRQGMPLFTIKAIGDFISKDKKITTSQFIKTSRMAGVAELIKEAEDLTQRFQIAAVPTLVIAGKYIVTTDKGADDAIALADQLVKQERADR